MNLLSFSAFMAGWRQKPALTVFAWISFTIGLFLALATLHVHRLAGVALEQLTDSNPAGETVIIAPAGTAAGGLSADELDLIGRQPFVHRVYPVTGNQFRPELFLQLGDRRYGTELFFESVPDGFLKPLPETWSWAPDQSAPVPILIPRDFLSLYNIGFAPARHLPPLNAAMLALVPIQIRISSAQGSHQLTGQVVGVTSQLTTILVPQSFMDWANQNYGGGKPPVANRAVLEVADAADPAITRFAVAQGLSLSSGGSGLREAVGLLQGLLAGLAALAALLLVLAVTVFLINQGSFMTRALPDLMVLVLLGHQPTFLALRAGLLNAIALLAVSGIALAGNEALAGRLSEALREMGLTGPARLEPALAAASLAIAPLLSLWYGLWYRRKLSSDAS
jgi:hypothetical protein